MADDQEPRRPYRKLQQRFRVVSRDDAIRFIKACEFKETNDPDVFERIELRKTKTRVAGNKVIQRIAVTPLIDNRDGWSRFVRRMREKYPDAVKALEEELAKEAGAPPKPGP